MKNKLPNTIRYHNRTYYKCIECGERASNNGGRCRKCRSAYTKTTIKKPHKKYPCRNNCGNLTTAYGSRCLSCYKKEASFIHKKKKTYTCKKCGAEISHLNGLCRACYDKVRRTLGEIKDAENIKRKDARDKFQESKHKPARLQICPKNPAGGSHVEIIVNNIGVCKFCGRKKDYSKLLEPYLPSIGM